MYIRGCHCRLLLCGHIYTYNVFFLFIYLCSFHTCEFVHMGGRLMHECSSRGKRIDLIIFRLYSQNFFQDVGYIK